MGRLVRAEHLADGIGFHQIYSQAAVVGCLEWIVNYKNGPTVAVVSDGVGCVADDIRVSELKLGLQGKGLSLIHLIPLFRYPTDRYAGTRPGIDQAVGVKGDQYALFQRGSQGMEHGIHRPAHAMVNDALEFNLDKGLYFAPGAELSGELFQSEDGGARITFGKATGKVSAQGA